MLKQSRKFIGWGGVVIALSLLFVNTALADSTGDRLLAYKGNKLIPQGITLPTADTAKSGTEQVVVFETSSLSWNSESAAIASFANYMGLTKEDWESVGKFFARDSEHDSEWFAKALQYLGKIQSGELTNPNLTPEDVQNLNEGLGVIIADGAWIDNCTFQPPFPKTVFEGNLTIYGVTFKDGIPDWDWSKAGEMVSISFSGMKSSDLVKFTGDVRWLDIGNIIVDDLTYPPMLHNAFSSGIATLQGDCPLEYQIAIAKENRNMFVRFEGDFSEVDMSGDDWAESSGMFAKVNETLLAAGHGDTYVDLMILQKEPDTLSKRFTSDSRIHKLDCTLINISSVEKLPKANNIILTPTQFDSLKSQILSADYDYNGDVGQITVRTNSGENRYKVEYTRDDETGKITKRELIKQ